MYGEPRAVSVQGSQDLAAVFHPGAHHLPILVIGGAVAARLCFDGRRQPVRSALGDLLVTDATEKHTDDAEHSWRIVVKSGNYPTLIYPDGLIADNVDAHGDFGPGNFLHDSGRVTALIDWELAHLGDPLEDLAWLTMRTSF